jgi:hypothetical protein
MNTCTDQIGGLLQEHHIELLLLGFPKCGTTAFADWLANCPQVDVSSPKETFLLCPEFAGNLERSAFRDADMAACFAERGDRMRMEASTLNVYSAALLAAVSENKHVKCIVLTRDPVQSTLSWHNQVVNAGFQVSDDFTESWERGLEGDESAVGQDFLRQYKRVASYGFWCSRWIEAVGHDRCLMLRAKDLRESPDLVKQRVEKFLGTELNVDEKPPERNKFAEPRSKFIYDAIRGSSFLKAFRSLEKNLQFLATLRRVIRDKVVLKPSKKNVDSQIEAMLREAFASDQELMQRLKSENTRRWE